MSELEAWLLVDAANRYRAEVQRWNRAQQLRPECKKMPINTGIRGNDRAGENKHDAGQTPGPQE